MIATIHAATEALRRNRLSPLDLLDACREQHRKYEPTVRAWVFVDWDDARAQAQARAEELQRGYDRGPLHGIPLGIKDIYDIFDWPTAAGSKLWAGAVARQEATVVQRLRQAGAVVLGKTVTTAYASFDPPPTRNPWNLDHTPGGSSSGSAAALATRMCLGALGSQTGGSITRPASYCGVAGLKPTLGRCSLHGVMPLAYSLDHAGPMATCVRDLAILLQAMAGPDPFDPTCALEPVPDYTAQVTAPLSRPPRFGRLRGLFEEKADPVMRRELERVCAELVSAGASIEEVALPAAFSEVTARHRMVMAVEALAFHEIRLRRHPDDYPPCITSLLREAESSSAVQFARTKEHQRELSREMAAVANSVDALLMPATRGPAVTADTTGDPVFNSPWSYTGLPAVSLPVAWSDNRLPLSLQLVGRPWSEATLLQVAAWCEERVGLEMGLPPVAG
jgi:aspartyl-tRNA(Asn)/glutamyl-tRNA(Gln) amidotransferase subunit A